MMEEILTQLKGKVLEITLNRPDKKNALTLQMYSELTTVLKAADQDEQVNVILLSGAGDSFCSGNDIADFVAAGDSPDTVNTILGFIHALADFSKPVVIAVHGDAVGIGTTMMLHCDLVIASTNLRCKMPFVQLGLIPEAGSTLLLPNMIGHRHAFELLVEGTPFDAQRAFEVGLVNKTVSESDLLAVAQGKAEGLANLPQKSVRNSKHLLKKEYLQQLHRVIDEEGSLFYESLFSEEARQALLGFLQKRP